MNVAVGLVLALAISTWIGYCAASLFWPTGLSKRPLWALSPVIGAGVCALVFFIFRRPMITVELILLLTLSAAWFASRRHHEQSAASRSPWRIGISGVLLAGVIGFVTAGEVVRIAHVPHGEWDGFAIWNSHARYLDRVADWQEGILNTFHPDYPLLTPSLTARLWRYAGQEAPVSGALVGLLFMFAGVAVTMTTLRELSGPAAAMAAGLVLVTTPAFLQHGVSQYSDVPLAVFMVSAIALLCLYFEDEEGRRGLLVLAGFATGCAGWTKNEGVLLILAISIVLLLPALMNPRPAFRRFAAFLAGLAAPLAVIVYFKVAIAPPGDITGGRQYVEVMEKLTNPDRYLTVFASFWKEFWSFGDWLVHPAIPLLVFLALKGIDRKVFRSIGWLSSVGVMAIVLTGYFAVYIVTPNEIRWHLGSSLPRLLLQLWPSVLLITGLTASRDLSKLGE